MASAAAHENSEMITVENEEIDGKMKNIKEKTTKGLFRKDDGECRTSGRAFFL